MASNDALNASIKIKGRQTKIEEPTSNEWVDQFRWTLWALTIFLKFPGSINAKGEAKFKLISFEFVYWVISTGFLLGISFCSCQLLVKSLVGMNVTSMGFVINSHNILEILFVLPYPMCLFSERRNTIAFINNWFDFQNLYRDCIGHRLSAKNKRLCKWITICGFPSWCGVLVFLRISVPTAEYNSWFLKIHRVSQTLYLTIYWIMSNIELTLIAESIHERILELHSLSSHQIEDELKKLRSIWLKLVEMIKLHSDSYCHSLNGQALFLHVIFVTHTFAFLSFPPTLTTNIFMLTVLPSCSICLFFIFECGHQLTEKAGNEISFALANMDTRNFHSEAVGEVKFFIKVVAMNYPTITFANMRTINRESITKIVSTSVTYLIIILQLKNSSS